MKILRTKYYITRACEIHSCSKICLVDHLKKVHGQNRRGEVVISLSSVLLFLHITNIQGTKKDSTINCFSFSMSFYTINSTTSETVFSISICSLDSRLKQEDVQLLIH